MLQTCNSTCAFVLQTCISTHVLVLVLKLISNLFQELELTARAHGISTPSLNPETQKLADAADQALGEC